MSSIDRPCTRPVAAPPRPGRRVALSAAALLALGLAAGCTSSPKDTCNDVSVNICEKLNGCGEMESTFVSQEQCVESFNGLFEVDNSDDAACRVEWTAAGSLDCADFLDRYSL